MDQQRNVFLIATALILVCCSWASAQDSGQGAQTTNGTASTSNAGSTSIINQQGAEAPRQFVNSYPGGGVGFPYPGFAVGNSAWNVGCVLIYQKGWTKRDIDIMRRKSSGLDLLNPAHWGSRFHTVRMVAEGDWKGDYPIVPICWSPYAVKPYPGDQILAIIEGLGEYDWPEEAYIAGALASGIPAGTRRVAILMRYVNSVVTNSRTLGLEGAGAIAAGSDNRAASASMGFGFGSTHVQVKDRPQIKIICLNAGPIEAPPQSMVLSTPPSPVQSAPQMVRVEVPEVKLQFDFGDFVARLTPLISALRQPLLPPAPAPAPLQVENACGNGVALPELTVFFDFDKSVVKIEYLPKIKEYVGWLAAHSACQVQVEGHTCRSGTFDYDAALARRRAKAVYDAFIAKGGKPEQIQQFVSVSKDRPASEYEEPNRRAILRIIGSASGK